MSFGGQTCLSVNRIWLTIESFRRGPVGKCLALHVRETDQDDFAYMRAPSGKDEIFHITQVGSRKEFLRIRREQNPAEMNDTIDITAGIRQRCWIAQVSAANRYIWEIRDGERQVAFVNKQAQLMRTRKQFTSKERTQISSGACNQDFH